MSVASSPSKTGFETLTLQFPTDGEGQETLCLGLVPLSFSGEFVVVTTQMAMQFLRRADSILDGERGRTFSGVQNQIPTSWRKFAIVFLMPDKGILRLSCSLGIWHLQEVTEPSEMWDLRLTRMVQIQKTA